MYIGLEPMRKKLIGGFAIVPFSVPHNETACEGFLIQHKDFGKLLFITDAEMCPYDMSKVGINHLLIECNYSKEYVNLNDPNTTHIFRGHMELQTCRRFISTVYSENLRSIGLIHLSNKNADSEAFRDIIHDDFPGPMVWVADKNISYEEEKDMNHTVLCGRLTKPVDVRRNGESVVARYTLAVDRRFKREGDQSADFIPCVVFGKSAEFAEKYFQKGTKIIVQGRIQTGSYTNKDGQKVYTTDVIVEDQEFAESKNASQQNQAPVQNQMPPQMQNQMPPQQSAPQNPQYQQMPQQAMPQQPQYTQQMPQGQTPQQQNPWLYNVPTEDTPFN